jgi:hypothetical protein
MTEGPSLVHNASDRDIVHPRPRVLPANFLAHHKLTHLPTVVPIFLQPTKPNLTQPPQNRLLHKTCYPNTAQKDDLVAQI